MIILITLIILIFSAIFHEVSHGWMAERLGDSTARDEGRITLNPIPHIDLYGTILLPALMWVMTAGHFWFGAAKPVPVNFNNLRNPRSGMALVSLAGPASNFLLAAVAALAARFLSVAGTPFYPVLLLIAYINILLGTFNLIPLPPLDGSKIVASLAPADWMHRILEWERYGFILVIIFVYLGWFGYILTPVLLGFFHLFGLNLADLFSLLG